MTDDLLTRIRREIEERMQELRGAVEERDRLLVDLRELDAHPESPVDLGVAVDPEPAIDLERSATVISFPARPELARTPVVSPKVARLMLAPRRPALERAGVARVAL
jgi:hypothetical protein